MRIIDFLTIVCQTLLFSVATNPNHPAAPPPDGHGKFADKKEVHDSEHIKQHLQDRIDLDTAKLNEEQERFHYFSMHDLNKDSRIDGTEIIKAMMHEHNLDANPAAKMEDSTLETMVDSILKEIDVNNDGYVDYSEYVKYQMQE